MRPAIKLIVSIAIPLATGLIAGWFTSQAVDSWYPTLRKPEFAPPNAVFGPVWTVLYILMGISLYIIWRLPDSPKKEKALFLFGIQLAFNFCWSLLFFYLRNPAAALVDIILLWIFILLMMRRFYKLEPVAAWLNIPYLLWVSFAAVLNASFHQLN